MFKKSKLIPDHQSCVLYEYGNWTSDFSCSPVIAVAQIMDKTGSSQDSPDPPVHQKLEGRDSGFYSVGPPQESDHVGVEEIVWPDVSEAETTAVEQIQSACADRPEPHQNKPGDPVVVQEGGAESRAGSEGGPEAGARGASRDGQKRDSESDGRMKSLRTERGEMEEMPGVKASEDHWVGEETDPQQSRRRRKSNEDPRPLLTEDTPVHRGKRT
ncbi:hypothetical protein GJAV_G00222810 [Gymnothorax javanicus]|nr:hypothetical protein GJAV_G00222810 [Gymnothorax javanicus]